MTNAVCIMCGTRSGDAALLAEKIADRIAEKDAEIERLRAEAEGLFVENAAIKTAVRATVVRALEEQVLLGNAVPGEPECRQSDPHNEHACRKPVGHEGEHGAQWVTGVEWT